MTQPVAIIIGAARGIGMACAQTFAREGYRLLLCGRQADSLHKVAKSLGAAIFAGDVRSPNTAPAIVETATATFGRLDVLVNAAGIAKNVPLLDLELETWNDLFVLHATATFLCCQAAARAMVKQGEGGAIINLSSMAASMSMVSTGAYGAAKAAVSALTRSLAVELASHGIRVNAIAPGPVATEQLRNAYGPAGFIDRGRSIPMNRIAEPEECADLAVFLASSKARYLTGQVIPLDGGASAVGAYSYDTYRRNTSTSQQN